MTLAIVWMPVSQGVGPAMYKRYGINYDPTVWEVAFKDNDDFCLDGYRC